MFQPSYLLHYYPGTRSNGDCGDAAVTVSTFTTLTATFIPPNTQTLQFNSAPAEPGCFPEDLIDSFQIKECD